jgi:hypothetical protein
MAVVVTNVGVYERDTSGIRTTSTEKATKTGALSGTVRSVYQGIEYVFGPGESKTFADNGIANGVIAGAEKGLGTGNGPLRLADTREGFRATGRT